MNIKRAIRTLAIVLGIGALATLSNYVNTAERDDSGVIVRPGEVDVNDFRIGDCIRDLPTLEDGETGEVSEGRATPCDKPHEFEVYAMTNAGSLSATFLTTSKQKAKNFAFVSSNHS
jgi:hypothetical protein